MLKFISAGALLTAIGLLGHRVYQVTAQPTQIEPQVERIGYGERWIRFDDERMVFVGMKFNPLTDEWEVVHYLNWPVKIDNRLGGDKWLSQ